MEKRGSVRNYGGNVPLEGLPRDLEGAAWHRFEIMVVLLDGGADEKDIGLVAKGQAYRRRGGRSQ